MFRWISFRDCIELREVSESCAVKCLPKLSKFALVIFNMIQELLVWILVIAAVVFIGKRLYDNFRHKKGDGGCEKCEPTSAKGN